MSGIFISYRREDAPGHAGRLYDALSARFGDEQVFMDLSMEPGVDFVEQITEAVGSCRMLIAVIGPRWATAEDARGGRRLDDPADFIRIEIEAGLRQPDVRVVPVLVQGATMPSAGELPSALAELSRRNALELSEARWRYDVERLASTAERLLVPHSRGSPAAERVDRADRKRRRGRRASEHRSEAVPPDGDARPRPAAPSRLRPAWRLAIAAVVVVALVAVVVVIAAGGDDDGAPSGGDDGAPSESRLLELIPAGVQEAGCRRRRGERFWMKPDYGAVAQYDCGLPSSVTSEAVKGGDLTYGLFWSADEAQAFVENDFQDELGKQANASRSCGVEARARLEAEYRGGNAECYLNDEGVFINWSYRGSPVAVQLYLGRGTDVDAAVAVRTKVL